MDHPSTKPTRMKPPAKAVRGPTNREILGILRALEAKVESNERAATMELRGTRSIWIKDYQGLIVRLSQERHTRQDHLDVLQRDLFNLGMKIADLTHRSPWQALKDWWAAW